MNTDPTTQGRLAEPWQRLAASITDVFIIFCVHLAALGLLILYAPQRIVTSDAIPAVSVVFGWLYMWAGWTFFGATPGKALWRLRVVTEDGGRLGAGRAALRCLGYALASLPVKLGLLPILWDARRQGWHDRIAGTVVLQHAAHGCGRPRLPHRPTL